MSGISLWNMLPELDYDLQKGETSLRPQGSHRKTCIHHCSVGSPIPKALIS